MTENQSEIRFFRGDMTFVLDDGRSELGEVVAGRIVLTVREAAPISAARPG